MSDPRDQTLAAVRALADSWQAEVEDDGDNLGYLGDALAELRAALDATPDPVVVALDEVERRIEPRIARNIGGHPYGERDRGLADAISIVRKVRAEEAAK